MVNEWCKEGAGLQTLLFSKGEKRKGGVSTKLKYQNILQTSKTTCSLVAHTHPCISKTCEAPGSEDNQTEAHLPGAEKRR